MQEKVYFKNSKGQRLVGIIDRDETKATQKLAMIFGNFNSYKDSAKQISLSEFFVSLGFATFRFDYRGRGESEGDISYATFTSGVEDTRAALEFMKNQLWVDINKIGLFGSGLGAAFAVLEAARNSNYKFLVLGAPRAEIRSLYKNADIDDWRENDFYHAKGVNYHISIHDDSLQYDIYKDAKKVEVPTLIVSGDGEDIHLDGQDKKLKKAIKGSDLIVVEECNNMYCAVSKDDALEILKTWLIEKHIIYLESEWISQF
ncbi:MAG: alpha/beta hydrolase [Lactobacillaceae bacterium]|jgi:pimeloyl-ACP methyl ester carboxylesterase|nr:alpha/beta hydrolase [Lactobacillaceae bacterium]